MAQEPKAKRPRRSNNEGSVFRRVRPSRSPNGSPRVTYVAQVTVDGVKRTSSHPTEAAAKKALRVLLAEAESGAGVGDGNLTVGELLAKYERRLASQKLAPGTVLIWRQSVKTLTAELGTVRVKRLTPDMIERAFERLADPGYMSTRDGQRRTSNAGMSRATLAKKRAHFAKVLDWAVARRLTQWNPARLAELPAEARAAKPGRSLTYDEAARFLDAAEASPLAALWAVMLYCGLRPGEACGLTWDDVDLAAGVLHVRRQRREVGARLEVTEQLKTASSRRSLAMPPEVVDALRAHRKRQAAAKLAASRWDDEYDVLFTTSVGTPYGGSNLRREFDKVTAAAELGADLSPHVLRHSCASFLVERGYSLTSVADVLGHKTTVMLESVYRHKVTPLAGDGISLGGALRRSAEA